MHISHMIMWVVHGKLWKVLRDTASGIRFVKKFHEVCDAGGIHYYLLSGTAIDAVRHGGFIPWEDIDVGLLRMIIMVTL